MPSFDEQGRLNCGTIEFDYFQMKYAAMEITTKDGTPRIPWRIIGDTAHEIFHARQYLKYPNSVNREHRLEKEGTLDWFQARKEYAATLYQFQFVKNYPTTNLVDKIDKWFYLSEIRNKLKYMRKSRQVSNPPKKNLS